MQLINSLVLDLMVRNCLKTLNKFLLPTYILILFSVSVYAQRYTIRNFSVQDGLPQSQISAIFQDRDGYLWIGTYDGLSRFDGREFRNFYRHDGLAENFVRTIMQRRNGDIWFGHYHGHISVLNHKTGKLKHLILPEHIKHSMISHIYEDDQSRIWIATIDNGVVLVDGEEWTTISADNGLPATSVFEIFQIAADRFLVATDTGLVDFTLRGSGDYIFHLIPERDGLPDLAISSILKTDSGKLLIGTYGDGVYSCSIKDILERKYRFTRMKFAGTDNDLFIIKLMQDNTNRLWIATESKGIIIYDPEPVPKINVLNKRNGLIENDVLSLVEDNEGSVWIGTDGGGLFQYLGQYFSIVDEEAGLPSNVVWALEQGKGQDYWIGTEKGLHRVTWKEGNLKINDIRLTNSGKKLSVQAVTLSRDGSVLFIAGNEGLHRFYPDKNKLVRYRQTRNIDAFYVTEERNGNIWLATYGNGAWLLNSAGEKIKKYEKADGLNGRYIYSVLIDRQNNKWFSCEDEGLVKFDGKKFSTIELPGGVSRYSAQCIAEDVAGNIWFGTENYGAYRVSPDSIERFGTSNGLNSDNIVSIAFDKFNHAWFGTYHGVDKMDLTTKTVQHFSGADGFLPVEANQNAVLSDREGNIFFGTIGGIVKIKPDELKQFNVPPKLALEKISLFFSDIPFQMRHKFKYNENYFTFKFTGISLRNSNNVVYSYRLTGLNDEWFPDTRERMATFANLPPGEYTFMVRARFAGSKWGTQIPAYDFVILAPFWKQSWFMPMMILFLFFVTYLFIIWRLRKIEKDNLRLEKKVTERTEELENEKRLTEKAYRAMQVSEKKYRLLMEQLPLAVIIHVDRKVVFCNRTAVSLFAAERQSDLIGKTLNDLTHPEHHAQMNQRVGLLYQYHEKVQLREIVLKRLNGEHFYAEVSGVPIEFEGKVAGQAVIHDVTERKKWENRLLQEKERMAVTLASIEDGVITTDSNNRIVLINDAALTLIEKTREECVGLELKEVLRVQSPSGPADPFAPVLEEYSVAVNKDQLYIEKTDSRHINVEMSSAPLYNEYGRIAGHVIVIRDITEKLQIEYELIKSQKLESVGLLAGGIAHDFNNILTGIIGNLSLAKIYLNKNEKSYQIIEKAENAGLRARDLTQQLLTFSKGGAPVRKTASIYNVVKDSSEFVLSGSHVQGKIGRSDNLWNVDIDVGQISQVVQNLIINAVQAMPDGGTVHIDLTNKELETRSHHSLKPGKYVCISIRDEGIGIPKEHLTRIFDPYFTTKQEGSGLGLATAFSIIDKHGGLIETRSKLGKGTTFTIWLPASKGRIEQESGNNGKLERGTGKILVMDDDDTICGLASQILTHLGYEVSITHNGKDALERYEQALLAGNRFDLVILDLTIPGGMGGCETVSKLQELDPKVKAIVSSGYSNDPVLSDYQSFGFVDVLSKPYRIESMSAVVSKQISE